MKSGELASLLGCELIGDPEVALSGIAALGEAVGSDLTFSVSSEPIETSAGCVIVHSVQTPVACRSFIVSAEPKLTFAKAAPLIKNKAACDPGAHPSADIAPSAKVDGAQIGPFVTVGNDTEVGRGTRILAGARIGANVTIGADCLIGSNVVIENASIVGDNVILHSGVVIGADGFGFVRDEDSYIKFPQVGRVVIGSDVEIGANSCVDRGALGETRIGSGTKIDNLVQIAHNVVIGKRVIIAAQTGISGSTVVEDDCVIGGQVGMGDHARVLSGAVIGSQAGVLPGKIVRPGVWWGTPVQPLDEYKRQNAHVRSLGRLKDELKELKKRLSDKL